MTKNQKILKKKNIARIQLQIIYTFEDNFWATYFLLLEDIFLVCPVRYHMAAPYYGACCSNVFIKAQKSSTLTEFFCISLSHYQIVTLRGEHMIWAAILYFCVSDKVSFLLCPTLLKQVSQMNQLGFLTIEGRFFLSQRQWVTTFHQGEQILKVPDNFEIVYSDSVVNKKRIRNVKPIFIACVNS